MYTTSNGQKIQLNDPNSNPPSSQYKPFLWVYVIPLVLLCILIGAVVWYYYKQQSGQNI